MKFIRLWLTAILIIFIFSVSGQHRYIEKMLNVESPDSKNFLMVDKIGQIILSGYLDGKIMAYRYLVKDSVLKWSEPVSISPNWKNSEYYFAGDRVLHLGKAYEAQIEAIGQEPTDFGNDFWARVELREPLLKRRYYPSGKDTLSKAEFLERMVAQQPVNFPTWDAKYDFYAGDAVSFRGRVYESIQDNKGIEPSSNSDYWAPTNQGSIQYYRLSDAKTVSVLFNYTVTLKDTIWNPQMIAVNVWDDNYGAYKQLAYFYYDDVMNYLEKVPQPVINNLISNRLSNFLLLQNQLQRPEYLKWLKAKFKTKAITAAPKWISDPKLFQAWLTTSDSADNFEDYDKWRFFQDLNSRNLVLVRTEWGVQGLTNKRFITIPVKSLEKLYQNLKVESPTLKTYSDVLLDMTYLTAPLESHYIDSIQPLLSHFKPNIQVSKQYYFIQKYTASITDGQNSVVAKQLLQAWSIIEKLFYARTIKVADAPVSFFEDNYNWRKLKYSKETNARYDLGDFNLGNYRRYQLDSIPPKFDPTGLSVTYRKYFSMSKVSGKQFESIYVAVLGFNREAFFYYPISFEWYALKEHLLKSGTNFDVLIKAIETGNLEFYDSELVYGLREN